MDCHEASAAGIAQLAMRQGQDETENTEEIRLDVSLGASAAEDAQSASAPSGLPQDDGENWSLYHCPPEGETIAECKQ
jgi:hypothetical protein